jgi:hypothetical protein
MMVYDTQNYRVSGLRPLSEILILFPFSGKGSETPTLLGPLGKDDLNYWTTHIT